MKFLKGLFFLNPPISCRHATISKFFGDKTPNCDGACDFCRNPRVVRAQLESAATLNLRVGAAQSTEATGPFGFQPGSYEGGKRGYGFERQDELLLYPLKCGCDAFSMDLTPLQCSFIDV